MVGSDFLLLLMLVGTGLGKISPPERSYKILMLLAGSNRSHRNVFMPLVEALAERGHKVDMLSSYDVQHQNPNIREIPHGLPHFPTYKNMNLFEAAKTKNGLVHGYKVRMCNMARDMYHLPHVMELYRKRKEYDVIVIDHFAHEYTYPFVHEMSFITIATSGMESRQSAMFGNVLSLAYVPGFFHRPNFDSVFGRLANAIAGIMNTYYWSHWEVLPAVQKEVSLHFPDLPPLLEIERNQSLTLLNSHFSISLTVPILPTQVEVGGMHCRPANPLPEDLMSWIEGAGSAGIIYFSIGSVVQGTTMPQIYRKMFIEAFSKLEQRILWKYEADLKGIPKNVMIKKWLPQQDILGHPNVKVFLTHGGLLSLQEALYHDTPMVALPVFGDQPTNADIIVANGWGLSLSYETLSVDLILNSLKEVMSNPKYKQNTEETSKLFRDQLNSPVERAVFWTEYVIRHKGAPKLRSPAAKLTWVQFLMLDALAVCLVFMIFSLHLLRWIYRKTVHVVFGEKYLKEKSE